MSNNLNQCFPEKNMRELFACSSLLRVCSLWGICPFFAGCAEFAFSGNSEYIKGKNWICPDVFVRGYFVMGIPTVCLLKRCGYKRELSWDWFCSVLVPFILPGNANPNFPPFFVWPFCNSMRADILGNSANPYTTVLGTKGCCCKTN